MKRASYCLLVISIFLFVRCKPSTHSSLSNSVTATWNSEKNNISTPDQEGIPQQETITHTPNAVRTLPSNKAPTITVQPITTMPSPTVTSSSPTPTLTSEQKANNFSRLMKENGYCELPCWWGIVLGESIFSEISEQFLSEGFWIEDNWLGGGTSHAISIEFELENHVVQSMKISDSYAKGIQNASDFIGDWERYSLDQVLFHYGMPSNVFVYYPYRPDPGSDPAFHLFIFYDEQGIAIDYVGNATDKNGGKSVACPNLDEIFQINLFLYQPSRVKNVIETVIPPETVSFIAEPETVYDLISWEQATDTTLESFYEQFSQPDFDGCFDFKRYWTSQ